MNNCMKYKNFSLPHFLPISRISFLVQLQNKNTWCIERLSPPIKNVPILSWLASSPPPPHVMTLKSPPNLNAPSGPINITTMIRQHTKFPPGRPTHRAIHCPTANFGQPSTCSITNPMLVTAFDTYLTPRSPGAW